MRADTVTRKKAIEGLKAALGRDVLTEKMMAVFLDGKRAMDTLALEMGKTVAEAIMYIEREERSGPDYQPLSDLSKWASQRGSIFLGDQKVPVQHPRLRGPWGEVPIETYGKLKQKGPFSEELLAKVLRGVSENQYAETVVEAAKAFGVSASSVSNHIVDITTKKLKEFKERDLSGFNTFAVYLDTIHRGGEAFIVALGLDLSGDKQVLGFWQGATENHVLCDELLSDLERRGLKLPTRIFWITDGGRGVIKTLRAKFGPLLNHQRCTIHKDRNIQKHLAKRYRKEASRKFRTALEQVSYDDAKKMLLDLELWLRAINASAADSLLEALEEILTLHRLKVPELLRKSLHSTNPIESMFSMVRDCEGNIKQYRKTNMTQRWLAAVCLHCEKKFNRIRGFASIPAVVATIEAHQDRLEQDRTAA